MRGDFEAVVYETPIPAVRPDLDVRLEYSDDGGGVIDTSLRLILRDEGAVLVYYPIIPESVAPLEHAFGVRLEVDGEYNLMRVDRNGIFLARGDHVNGDAVLEWRMAEIAGRYRLEGEVPRVREEELRAGHGGPVDELRDHVVEEVAEFSEGLARSVESWFDVLHPEWELEWLGFEGGKMAIVVTEEYDLCSGPFYGWMETGARLVVRRVAVVAKDED